MASEKLMRFLSPTSVTLDVPTMPRSSTRLMHSSSILQKMITHPTSDAYDARREHRHRGKKKYAEIDARSVYHFSILGCWTGLLDADVCSTFAEEANDDGIESELP